MTAPQGSVPIRGWLLVFVATALVALGRATWNITRTARTVWLVRGSQDPLGLTVRTFASARLGIQLVVAAAIVFGLILLFRRDARTRQFYLWFLPLVLLVRVAYKVLWIAEARALTVAGQPTPSKLTVGAGFIAGVVGGTIWWVYWLRSRRVRETFGPIPGADDITERQLAS